MTNLDSVLKRDVTLPTKFHIVRAMVFLVVMYGCESWTIKKAKCQKMETFELWCWRRLLRVSWTARRSKPSILKEISPEYSLEELMLSWNSNTLAAWYEELTHWKIPWCWERLKTGEGDNRGWDGWMALPTWCTWVWASSGSWWWTGTPGVLQSMRSQRGGHNWATELNVWSSHIISRNSVYKAHTYFKTCKRFSLGNFRIASRNYILKVHQWRTRWIIAISYYVKIVAEQYCIWYSL